MIHTTLILRCSAVVVHSEEHKIFTPPFIVGHHAIGSTGHDNDVLLLACDLHLGDFGADDLAARQLRRLEVKRENSIIPCGVGSTFMIHGSQLHSRPIVLFLSDKCTTFAVLRNAVLELARVEVRRQQLRRDEWITVAVEMSKHLGPVHYEPEVRIVRRQNHAQVTQHIGEEFAYARVSTERTEDELFETAGCCCCFSVSLKRQACVAYDSEER